MLIKNINGTGRWKFLLNCMTVALLILFFENSYSQKRTTRFEEMKGTQFLHPISDQTDTLSSQEIIELRDQNGLSVWFARDIMKSVCLSGKCRIVRVRIFWTGAINYYGFEVPENEPLTKTDHVVFTDDDYERLNKILSDEHSILKQLELKDLIVETPGKKEGPVDAYSGATLPVLQDFVVKNAVYTCYSLWHTVYGNTKNLIGDILEERVDDNYLHLVFNGRDPEYLSWAIDFIGKHPKFHSAFYPEILNLVKSKDRIISSKALQYFIPLRIIDPEIQKELALVVKEAPTQIKFDIVWAFSSIPMVSDEAILIMLKAYEDQQINAGLLGYVVKLIRPGNMKNDRIHQKVKQFSSDKNLYIRNMMQNILIETSQKK